MYEVAFVAPLATALELAPTAFGIELDLEAWAGRRLLSAYGSAPPTPPFELLAACPSNGNC